MDSELESSALRVGLIIQGPLLSRGRRPSSMGKPMEEVSEEEIVDYLCVDDITAVYSSLPKDFSPLLVTWEDDYAKYGSSLPAELPRLVLANPFDESRVLDAKLNLYDNKRRQAMTILAGLNFFGQRGFDYGVKIRTDQRIDAERLLRDLRAVWSRGEQRIVLPYARSDDSRHFGDFYFGGPIWKLKEFMQSVLNEPELSSHVHHEYFFKLPTLMGTKRFFPRWLFMSTAFDFYAAHCWSRVLTPLSSVTFSSLVWRGEQVKPKQFSFDMGFLEDAESGQLRQSFFSKSEPAWRAVKSWLARKFPVKSER